MNGDLITIGVPCYNAADTVERAVRSALAQDYPNIEVIVVDDCSTDDTAERAAACIEGEARATLVRHEQNLGPAGARNTVLEHAAGEFVAFFDDDDESAAARVNDQRAAILSYEHATGASLVACYASGERRYPGGYVLDLDAIGSQGEQPPRGREVADYLLFYGKRKDRFYGAGTPTFGLMARRRVFDAVGGFDPEMRRVEDADFAVRLGLQGGHCIGVAEKLVTQYATSAPDKSPEMNLEAEQQLVRKHREYLESIGRWYYALHWSRLRYWHFTRKYGRFLLELAGLWARYPVLTTLHLLDTGPKRLAHEHRIRRGGDA